MKKVYFVNTYGELIKCDVLEGKDAVGFSLAQGCDILIRTDLLGTICSANSTEYSKTPKEALVKEMKNQLSTIRTRQKIINDSIAALEKIREHLSEL